MNCKDIYKQAYLEQLNIIKECADTECKNCTNEENETDVETTVETPLKKVCFLTTDSALIDALNSGIEEVVFFVNKKDEESGEVTVSEVKIGKDSFSELEITDAEEEAESDDEIEDEIEEEADEEPETDEELVEEDEEEVEAEEELVEEEDEGELEECKKTLNECNKILSSVKTQRFSKYGPY